MPDITRKQVIVVDTVESNDYGDMLFTDKEGKNYKIGSKRVEYFLGIITEGVAVELSYSTAYNKEYIYSAVQVKDGLPPPTQTKTQPEGDAPAMARSVPRVAQPGATPPKPPTSSRDANINMAVGFKGAIDLVCHGMISVNDIDLWWDKFVAKMNK